MCPYPHLQANDTPTPPQPTAVSYRCLSPLYGQSPSLHHPNPKHRRTPYRPPTPPPHPGPLCLHAFSISLSTFHPLAICIGGTLPTMLDVYVASSSHGDRISTTDERSHIPKSANPPFCGTPPVEARQRVLTNACCFCIFHSHIFFCFHFILVKIMLEFGNQNSFCKVAGAGLEEINT